MAPVTVAVICFRGVVLRQSLTVTVDSNIASRTDVCFRLSVLCYPVSNYTLKP